MAGTRSVRTGAAALTASAITMAKSSNAGLNLNAFMVALRSTLEFESDKVLHAFLHVGCAVADARLVLELGGRIHGGTIKKALRLRLHDAHVTHGAGRRYRELDQHPA